MNIILNQKLFCKNKYEGEKIKKKLRVNKQNLKKNIFREKKLKQ